MGFASALHDLKTLVLSFHPAIAIESSEEERIERIVDAVAEDLGLPVFEWTVTCGLVRRPATRQDSHRATAEPTAMLAHIGSLSLDAIYLIKDIARHLEDPVAARAFRDTVSSLTGRTATLVLCGAAMQFPAEVAGEIVPFEIALPEEKELGAVVDSVVASVSSRRPGSGPVGAGAARIDPTARDEIVRALQGMTLNQARQTIARCLLGDGALDASDLPDILQSKATHLGEDGVLEYYPAEDNPYELGGFERLTQWLERARMGFSPKAAALNLDPPKGFLLVGVQGCGKSLAAKWLARQWAMPLLKLDAGRLFNKYIGETERNLRRAIAVAESMAPAVLWIDEIEKAFAGSKVGVDQDGGVSQRILATFLTWMQEKRGGVFVVATANDIMALPPELLRKGRFDEIFFVDLPEPDERRRIFEIHLSLRKQGPELFDLDALVAATTGFSGAEIEQVVIASLYATLHEEALLDTARLLEEISQTRPLSVSRREDVERLRAMARERFVPVR